MDCRNFVFLSMVCALLSTGCGVSVPEIKEFYEKDLPPTKTSDPGLSGTALLEFEIKKKVFCELSDAVRAAQAVDYETGEYEKERPSKKGFLPSDWGAEVSLSLQVDESAALNPGAAISQPLPNALTGFGGPTSPSTFAQSFAFGLGGSFSSASTRNDKFDQFYTIAYLAEPLDPTRSVCFPANDPVLQKVGQSISSPFLIDSQLGLKDWLVGALLVNHAIPSVGKASEFKSTPSGFHPDTLTIEIKFIVITNGNITPSWKLVRVAANTSTPLFALGRMRTHDLIITIGPRNTQTANTHLASQIGNAVSNANRAAIPLQ